MARAARRAAAGAARGARTRRPRPPCRSRAESAAGPQPPPAARPALPAWRQPRCLTPGDEWSRRPRSRGPPRRRGVEGPPGPGRVQCAPRQSGGRTPPRGSRARASQVMLPFGGTPANARELRLWAFVSRRAPRRDPLRMLGSHGSGHSGCRVPRGGDRGLGLSPPTPPRHCGSLPGGGPPRAVPSARLGSRRKPVRVCGAWHTGLSSNPHRAAILEVKHTGVSSDSLRGRADLCGGPAAQGSG